MSRSEVCTCAVEGDGSQAAPRPDRQSTLPFEAQSGACRCIKCIVINRPRNAGSLSHHLPLSCVDASEIWAGIFSRIQVMAYLAGATKNRFVRPSIQKCYLSFSAVSNAP